jgi:RimJ/RimL family protein N-acetyltransferase
MCMPHQFYDPAEIILTSSRLVYRDYLDHDATALSILTDDVEVLEYVPWGPYNRQAAQRFVANTSRHRHERPRLNYILAVCDGEAGNIVGGCGIYITNIVNREGSICYWLGRQYWGLGYATEIAASLLKFGFGPLGLHRITATCDPCNSRSAGVLRRVNMRYEGTLRAHLWQRVRWRDSQLYSALEGEWESNWTRQGV